jgi:hypothetical protein
MVLRFFVCLVALVTPATAYAAGGVPVPEGSQFTLFGLGLLGVIIGRRASMRRSEDDREQD